MKCTAIIAFTTIMNVVLNVFLISSWGAKGAALASSISGFVQLVFLFLFSRKEMDYKKSFHGVWKIVVCGLIMFIIATGFDYVLKYYSSIGTLSRLIIVILSGIISYLLLSVSFKEEPILDLMNKIKNKLFHKKTID